MNILGGSCVYVDEGVPPDFVHKERVKVKRQARSQREQAVALSRVAAAMKLQQRRPGSHRDETKYDRNKAKRLWHKDQEALCYVLWGGLREASRRLAGG